MEEEGGRRWERRKGRGAERSGGHKTRRAEPRGGRGADPVRPSPGGPRDASPRIRGRPARAGSQPSRALRAQTESGATEVGLRGRTANQGGRRRGAGEGVGAPFPPSPKSAPAGQAGPLPGRPGGWVVGKALAKWGRPRGIVLPPWAAPPSAAPPRRRLPPGLRPPAPATALGAPAAETGAGDFGLGESRSLFSPPPRLRGQASGTGRGDGSAGSPPPCAPGVHRPPSAASLVAAGPRPHARRGWRVRFCRRWAFRAPCPCPPSARPQPLQQDPPEGGSPAASCPSGFAGSTGWRGRASGLPPGTLRGARGSGTAVTWWGPQAGRSFQGGGWRAKKRRGKPKSKRVGTRELGGGRERRSRGRTAGGEEVWQDAEG